MNQHARRRSREEVEQDLVGAPAPAPTRSFSLAPWIGIGLVVLVTVLWLLSPRPEIVRDKGGMSADVYALQRKLAADKERAKRMQSSGDFMDRMAARDAQILGDLASRAAKLVQIADVSEAPAAPARKPAKPAVPPPVQSTRAKPETKPEAAPETSPAPPSPTTVASAAPATASSSSNVPSAQETSARPAQCKLHVSELSSSGKLTYDDIAAMKGSRKVGGAGHVLTPPVKVNDREVTFDVAPNGCVTVARTQLGR